MSSPFGYFRHPTIAGKVIIFVSEDDLWSVSAEGGIASRFTAGVGAASHPAISLSGKWVAFSSREEGHNEVYLMPTTGGFARRLTFLGAESLVVGWHPDGRIIFSSSARQFTPHAHELYAISPDGGVPERFECGLAFSISFGGRGRSVIGRNYLDPARWKRYRGGLKGEIWIDRRGNERFEKLVDLSGNMVRPLWVGGRIYFVSDHDGIGALYSVTPEGADLRLESRQPEHYIRFPSTDGKQIVYHAGGALFVFDPKTRKTRIVRVDYRSPRSHRNRKFVSPSRYLEDVSVSNDGTAVATLVRGKAQVFGAWEGSVLQLGEPQGVRYRRIAWLPGDKNIVVAVNRGGDDHLEVHPARGTGVSTPIRKPLGRVMHMLPAPKGDLVAVINHRNDLILVDLMKKTVQKIDRSPLGQMTGMDWSPDGQWLAYDCSDRTHLTRLKMYSVKSKKSVAITEPVLRDFSPHFDPQGRYLYFLSAREFNPVFDQLQFDLSFPCGIRPYLLVLSADTPHPFARDTLHAAPTKEPPAKGGVPPTKIDLDGLADRIVPLPIGEGRYSQILATDKRVYVTQWPIRSAVEEPHALAVNNRSGRLAYVDLDTLETNDFVGDVNSAALTGDRKWITYRSGEYIRIISSTEKPSTTTGYSKKSGWVNLGRLRIEVDPTREWQQMLHEAWVLQREHYWAEDMASVDWDSVYKRYRPLLDLVNTRTELSDLLWEMQGELGTSHAYEYGGDYRHGPHYGMGFLGATFMYDKRAGGYRVSDVLQGDVWNERRSSPLARPGGRIASDEVIVALNNQPLSEQVTLESLLVSHSNAMVALTVQTTGRRKKQRTISVNTLSNEGGLRYRAWVDEKKSYVHEKSGGRIGYIHIPDMGPDGFAAFHRLFLSECDRDGVIVDVRFNRGGFVSSLLLSKLARKHLGYDISRWTGTRPFPEDAIRGPMVALCNEYTASDGDIFSHCFKALNLGPLIGKRTWGGVIGINPRTWLVDGGTTTQPEYSFWFHEKEWGVENHGVDPDIIVEYPPHAYKSGTDPQLERGLVEALRLLGEQKSKRPDMMSRPKLTGPGLPVIVKRRRR